MDFENVSRGPLYQGDQYNKKITSDKDYSSLTTITEESGSECTITGLELKVSRIREIKKRLFAVSKRLQESSKEKAELMQRIGNMEIQLLHLKEIKVEEDFKRFTEFHKDLSEKSRLNLMALINDTKEMMEKEESSGSHGKNTSRNNSFSEKNLKDHIISTHSSQVSQSKVFEAPKMITSPKADFPYASDVPDTNQKWLRRHLMKGQGLNLPSICESTPVLYSKKPRTLPIKPVESQMSHARQPASPRESDPSGNESNSSLDQMTTIEQSFKTPCDETKQVYEQSDSSSSTEPSETNVENEESWSEN